MPHTRALLRNGVLSEWRATIVVRETACLTPSDRAAVDAAQCADPTTVSGLGDRELDARVREMACALDPHAVVDRNALVERVTGAAPAEQPVGIDLVLPSSILTDASDAAAHVPVFGPLPADTARRLIAEAVDAGADVEMRRLFACPDTGALVAMESRARLFPEGLRHLLTVRDRWCRIPFCDAPIAEIDHAHPHCDGGPTTATNGLGMCMPHNRATQNPGWRVTVTDDDVGRHTAVVTTPTGHALPSVAPPPPGHRDDTVGGTRESSEQRAAA
ncbi:HNH endonuclease signature motif containing protein [Williamsia deligens]|uniref:HNH endonuclease signature motif containing protein n=1 Tax=Williamsia deligens TaxID=321325 RepID=A0ABW3G389_9NOCA|nr:HNH endonuclease signature motif containing protein [Williamsia deligens]